MRAPVVTDVDIALLRALARERSVVAASRRVRISRYRAVYRLARLERAFGGPVVTGERGGRSHGGSRLTALGDRVARKGFDSVELLDSRPTTPPTRSNLFHGVYRSRPAPEVALARGIRLRVAFSANDGERVAAALDPESIVLARGRFPSSARNVLPARVTSVRATGSERGSTVTARLGPARLRVAVTDESVRQLRLTPGAKVWLYIKATAFRRVGARSRRSR